MMTMVSLIIKSYLAILLPVSIGSIFVFITGLYFIFRKKKPVTVSLKQNECKETPTISDEVAESTPHDIAAIAGDHVMATQLDLARAYIETGKKQLAKKILEQVITQGDSVHQEEARNLLGFI